MHDRAHRYRLVHRVDAGIALCELAHHRQALVDLLLAEMADIEVNDIAMRRADRATRLLLVPEGLAEAVARPQLHRLLARPGIGRAEIIILQVTIAILVDEDTALAA